MYILNFLSVRSQYSMNLNLVSVELLSYLCDTVLMSFLMALDEIIFANACNIVDTFLR